MERDDLDQKLDLMEEKDYTNFDFSTINGAKVEITTKDGLEFSGKIVLVKNEPTYTDRQKYIETQLIYLCVTCSLGYNIEKIYAHEVTKLIAEFELKDMTGEQLTHYAKIFANGREYKTVQKLHSIADQLFDDVLVKYDYAPLGVKKIDASDWGWRKETKQ